MTYNANVAHKGVACKSYADTAKNFEEKYHYKASKTQVEEITDFVEEMAFKKAV